MDNKVDNTIDKKDENSHLSKDVTFNPINLLCEALQNEISRKSIESNIRKDQKDSFKEEIPGQQQQEDIKGESELDKFKYEVSLPDNSDRTLDDNNVNYGSKLWSKDKKDGNYRMTQGIPGSKKFRSINHLYKCTTSLSAVEDEFNWNLPAKEDPNMNVLTKEDSSIITKKEDVGCKRKGRDNKNDKGEKDAATSSD